MSKPPCTVERCDKEQVAKGLCDKHYKQARRIIKPETEEQKHRRSIYYHAYRLRNDKKIKARQAAWYRQRRQEAKEAALAWIGRQ